MRHMQSTVHLCVQERRMKGRHSTAESRGDRIMSNLEQKAKGIILHKLSVMQNAWDILLNQIF